MTNLPTPTAFITRLQFILPYQTVSQRGWEVLNQLLLSATTHVIAWKVWGAFVLPIHQKPILGQGD